MQHYAAAFACGLTLAALVPALADSQEIKFADLDGFTISATIVRDNLIERHGRRVPVRVTQTWRVTPGPDETIQNTMTSEAKTPRGTRKSGPVSGEFTLGKVRSVHAAGGGQGTWQFADGKLMFLRTFKRGAYRAVFTLTRGDRGLVCTVEETFGRDASRRPTQWIAMADGQPVTLIRSKQVSGACRVSKP